MPRRSTPDRLDHARREGVRSRLVANGIRKAGVDLWLAAWEAQAPLLSVKLDAPDYWDAGAFWIESPVKAGARPQAE